MHFNKNLTNNQKIEKNSQLFFISNGKSMKKTKKLLLLATLIPVFLFSIVFVNKTNAQATTNTTNSSMTTEQESAYMEELKQLYTGYDQAEGGNSSVLSSAASGCVGSFVGNWLGNKISDIVSQKVSGAVGDMIAPSVPTDDKNQKSANYRDEVMNGIAFCIGNGLIDAMSASIVQWINNGFKNPDGTSGPGFLTNPGKFFQQIADKEVGGFFQGLGPIGNVLCKPFDLQIRLALLNEYNNRGNYQQQCSLASIKDNFSNFGSTDYMGDWFELTQQPNNNAIGSYFIARDNLANGINYNVDQNKMEIDLGKGFLNLKKCVKYSETKKDPNTGKPECTQWQTTTPGTEVQASLDRALGSKTGRIEIATNFNQIVSALVNQIVIMSVEGLRK
jgi:hypothetical protein